MLISVLYGLLTIKDPCPTVQSHIPVHGESSPAIRGIDPAEVLSQTLYTYIVGSHWNLLLVLRYFVSATDVAFPRVS